MLNFEIVKEQQNLGKRFLHSQTKWEESQEGFKLSEPIYIDAITNKLNNKVIKITCSDNEYFDIELIKGKQIQFTGSSSDNTFANELFLYRNKPNELYINLTSNLIDMLNSDALRREYLLKVVQSNQQKVSYYGIILTIKYKNNGVVNNLDYDFDISIYYHELETMNFVTNTIDIAFLSLLVFWIIMIISKTSFFDMVDYGSIAIVAAYLIQIILRTLYIKNTYLNAICNLFRRNRRKNNRFTKKQFEKRLLESYQKVKEENKTKKLTDL